MIRHIVLLRFRADVTASERAELLAGIDALRAHLPGMGDFKRLRNISPEAPVVHGFHDGLSIDFADAEARDAYLADAAHLALGTQLVAACEGGLAGLLVFDHVL